MGQIFYWVLNMAIVGTFVGGFILVLRKVKKFPRNFIYAMYAILLLRLICPFAISNPFSFLHLLPEGSVRLIDPVTGMEKVDDGKISLSNIIQSAESYQPMEQKSEAWSRVYEVGGWIWLMTAMTLLLIYIIMYLCLKRKLSTAIWRTDNIYQGEMVGSPITVGVI